MKTKSAALILSIFLGGLGIDRFYLGYTGMGVLKLLTGGCFGILWIIDIVNIATGRLSPANGTAYIDSVPTMARSMQSSGDADISTSVVNIPDDAHSYNKKHNKTLLIVIILCAVIGIVFFFVAKFAKSADQFEFFNSFPTSIEDIERHLGKPDLISSDGFSYKWENITVLDKKGSICVTLDDNRIRYIIYRYSIEPITKEDFGLTHAELFAKHGTVKASSEEITDVEEYYSKIYWTYISLYGSPDSSLDRLSIWNISRNEVHLVDFTTDAYKNRFAFMGHIQIEWNYDR